MFFEKVILFTAGCVVVAMGALLIVAMVGVGVDVYNKNSVKICEVIAK